METTKQEADSAAEPMTWRDSSPALNAGKTANERAYLALKEMVLSASFSPGEVLTLKSVSNRISFGDTPVREALKRLVSEGAFEGLPNRSARVPVLSPRETKQILDLRIQLESSAASLACENMTLHQIERLRGSHAAMGTAIVAGDRRSYGQMNMAFHYEIYRIADNKPLAMLIEALWLRMSPLIALSLMSIPSDPQQAWYIHCRHHDSLLVAFQNRDPEAARIAMREDLSEL